MIAKKRKVRFSFLNLIKVFSLLILVLIIILRTEIIGQPMLNMSFRYSDKKLINQFKHEDRSPEIKYLSFSNYTLRYLQLITDDDLPYVVFIHGAPGSSADYLEYFRDENLYSKVNLISVDRLGYGYSEFGNSETSIKVQGEAIQSIVNKACKNHNIIMVGHSYGGPIAVKIAMDFSCFYKGIILLAPALDPDNEKEIKLASLPAKQPIRWLTPLALRVAADEKNTHIKELRNIENDYGDITTPICHIHGNKDSLVPYENLSFSIEKINSKYLEAVTLENADHFLPWSHYNFVVEKILKMTETTSSLPSY